MALLLSRLSISSGLFLLISLILIGTACQNEQTREKDSISNTPKPFDEELRRVTNAYRSKAEAAGANAQLDSALHWYKLANKTYTATHQWDSVHATSLALFYTLYPHNQLALAQPFFDTFATLIPQEVDSIQAKMYELQGFVEYVQGDAEQMLLHYKKTIPIWEKYNNARRLAGSYNMLAIAYNILEDYAQVEPYYREGIRISRQLGDSITESNHLANLAIIQNIRGDWQASIESLERSHALNPFTDGFYEVNLAAAYITGNQLETARDYAQKGLAVALANEETPFTAYRALGDVAREMKDYDQAETYYRNALEASFEAHVGDHREIAKAHIDLGVVYQAEGLYNLALREYQEAIRLFLPGFTPKAVTDYPSPDSLFSREGYLTEALKYKGEILLDQYRANQQLDDLKLACEHFQAAVSFIHQNKLLHTEAGSKSFHSEYYSLPYIEDAIEATLLLHQKSGNNTFLSQAFELSQQATAFLLRETINDQRAAQLGGIAPDTLDLLSAYNQSISELKIQISENTAKEARDSLSSILLHQRTARLDLLSAIEKQYPLYYQLKHALTPSPLSELQATISPQTLVVKYFLGQKNLYAFAFSKSEMQVSTLAIDSSFYQKINSFRKTLSDLTYIREYAAEAEKTFLDNSHALYQALVQPSIEPFDDQFQKLIIIPDGVLNYLSFECLLSRPAETWSDPAAYLINDYAIQYAYYSGLLQQQQSAKPQSESKFLGFGVEYDDQTLDAMQINKQDSIANPDVNDAFRGKQFAKLAFADDEVNEVSALLSGRAFVNKKATKNNFLKYAPDFEVVHIAAHTFIDTEDDSTAYIIFNQTEKDDDFLLSLPEVYHLKLNTELIALSGCQTGIGMLKRGEGVMSLARAFQFAGSNSLIASQWSISDRASSTIMKLFYEQLNEGVSKDEALRQAKLQYLTDDELSNPAYRIPAYWGALILIGDDKPVLFTSARNYRPWFIAAAIIGLLLLMSRLLFLKKQRTNAL
jgi:CHAT domain-containing protein